MGLSISYKIMEKYGGKVEFYSQVDSGTEFRIYLPIAQTVSPVVLARESKGERERERKR